MLLAQDSRGGPGLLSSVAPASSGSRWCLEPQLHTPSLPGMEVGPQAAACFLFPFSCAGVLSLLLIVFSLFSHFLPLCFPPAFFLSSFRPSFSPSQNPVFPPPAPPLLQLPTHCSVLESGCPQFANQQDGRKPGDEPPRAPGSRPRSSLLGCPLAGLLIPDQDLEGTPGEEGWVA